MPLKRGAPKGNTNRLKHGRYTAQNLAAQAELRRALRAFRAAIAEAKAFLSEQRLSALRARDPVRGPDPWNAPYQNKSKGLATAGLSPSGLGRELEYRAAAVTHGGLIAISPKMGRAQQIAVSVQDQTHGIVAVSAGAFQAERLQHRKFSMVPFESGAATRKVIVTDAPGTSVVGGAENAAGGIDRYARVGLESVETLLSA